MGKGNIKVVKKKLLFMRHWICTRKTVFLAAWITMGGHNRRSVLRPKRRPLHLTLEAGTALALGERDCAAVGRRFGSHFPLSLPKMTMNSFSLKAKFPEPA